MEHRNYRHESGMLGPFPFEREEITKLNGRMYGVYVLTMYNGNKVRVVIYVGRGLVRSRLTLHLRARGKKKALHFYYKPLRTKMSGFRNECRLYHRYGKKDHLLNEIHPPVPNDAPPGTRKCSVAGCNGEP